MISGHIHAWGFVRTSVIVFPTPSMGSSLLSKQAGRWRIEILCFVNPMHLFMPPILFRMSRLNKLHPDAEFDPPSAQARQAQCAAHCAALQKRLWDGLLARIPNISLNGPKPGPGRSPANLNISVQGTEGEGQVLMCDTRGISIASGTACLSKSLKPSHVLDAIGVDRDLAKAAIIISFGKDNTDDDVDYFLETYPKIVEKLRAMSPS
jgi:selenocysteine lyase/cysteine desulfurase